MKLDLQRICKLAAVSIQPGHGATGPQTPRGKIPGHEQQGLDDLDVQVAPAELDSGWQHYVEGRGYFDHPPPELK